MKTIKLNIGDATIEAESMSYKPIDEPWSLYRLEDGSTIRIKLVVSDVFKLPMTDPLTGLPQYVIKSGNVMSVEPIDTPLSKREVQ